MDITEKCFQEIKTHTLKEYPNEMCGIILKDESFIPLQNVSKTPEVSFKFYVLEYVKYHENIKVLIHSHISREKTLWDIRTPSFSDLNNQIKTNLPWGIVGTDGENVLRPIFFPRTPNNKYLGRKFFWYINDCRTIIQDYYWYEFGIELGKNYNMIDLGKVKENPLILKDHFLLGLQEEDFTEVDDVRGLKKGDVLVMDALPPFGNGTHVGVWTGEKVLHQELISKENDFIDIANRLRQVYRHPLLQRI